MGYGNWTVTDRRGYGADAVLRGEFDDRGALMAMPTAGAYGDPFEALGDANRREILRLLSGGDKPVHEIAAALPISRPAVSRHLRLLKGAGLVDDRPDGTRHIYELRGEGVDAIRAYFADVWENAATRFRIVAENTDAVDD